MKATIFAALVSVLSVAVQASGASWYVPSRNITCTGASDGHISCDAGHIDNAPEVALEHPSVARDIVPAIRGREASALEDSVLNKRLTCNLDGATEGLACFTHCFAIGYCNSHCNSDNICICTCKDETPWWDPIVCSKTSC